MDEAIEILREITLLTVDGHPAFPVPFTGLAIALEQRFNLRRSVRPGSTDLDDAFIAIDQAIALSRPDDEQLPQRHTFRIRFLGTKYDQTDDPAILDEAIQIGEMLHNAPSHPEPENLNAELAHLYTRRYDLTSDVSDIDAGVEHAREAVELSGGHPSHLADRQDQSRRDRSCRTSRPGPGQRA